MSGGDLVERLAAAACNVESARLSGVAEHLAGWEHQVITQAADEIVRLREEVSYLIDRSCEAGRCRFGGKRWTGMSSNAINAVAFGRDDPGDMPYDSADLAACYETIKRLPKHLLTERVAARLNEAEKFASQGYPDAVDAAREYAEWPGFAAAALTAYIEHGGRADIAENLTHGDQRMVPPGAIFAMIDAVLNTLKTPTPAMIEAGQAVDGTITAEEVYRAMIAAADDGGR